MANSYSGLVVSQSGQVATAANLAALLLQPSHPRSAWRQVSPSATELQLSFEIILPTALLMIFAGLRLHMGRAAAMALAPHRIRVNTLAPTQTGRPVGMANEEFSADRAGESKPGSTEVRAGDVG